MIFLENTIYPDIMSIKLLDLIEFMQPYQPRELFDIVWWMYPTPCHRPRDFILAFRRLLISNK